MWVSVRVKVLVRFSVSGFLQMFWLGVSKVYIRRISSIRHSFCDHRLPLTLEASRQVIRKSLLMCAWCSRWGTLVSCMLCETPMLCYADSRHHSAAWWQLLMHSCHGSPANAMSTIRYIHMSWIKECFVSVTWSLKYLAPRLFEPLSSPISRVHAYRG